MFNHETSNADEYLNSPDYTEDFKYWSDLISKFSPYIKFYNIKNKAYSSRPIRLNRKGVSDFMRIHHCSLTDFYGSLFAIYLSGIDRTEGCFLNISTGPESAVQKTLMKVDVNSKSSFPEVLGSFQSGLEISLSHTKRNISDYSKEKISYYVVYDGTGFHGPLDVTDEEFALALSIRDDRVSLCYNTDLFSDLYAENMVRNLEGLAETVFNDLGKRISESELLSEEEKKLISGFSKGKTIRVNREKCLSRAFREYAKQNPDFIAVDDGVNKISYKELEQSSNSAADDLSKKYGIGPGKRVALMLPRDYHFYELVLAVNKLGAAYVPIDMRLPGKRIGYMVGIARAEYYITVRSIAENLDLPSEIICLEDINYDKNVEVEIRVESDDLFAILFTSGTTGIPKGVKFSNRIFSMGAPVFEEMLHLKEGQTVGSYFSFGFVGAFFAFGIPYWGCTLRLINDEEQKDSMKLLKVLKETHMNNIALPPSVGGPLYENEDLNLDSLILGGAKLNEFSRKDRATTLINIYGTTEVIVAIGKTFDPKAGKDSPVSLGKPLPNTWVYILDREGRRMHVGVPGEICISGVLCSQGYVDDSELTSSRFVKNPYSDCELNEIMYRTGDIGFFNFDGEVEIVGREDNQLSLRGFRVESGEILEIMKRFPEIKEIYLDVEKENLIAYYTTVADGDSALCIDSVKEALAGELPDYMIPSVFRKLDRIPLNINGKIDQSALKTVTGQEQACRSDEVALAVAECFKEVLHLDCVSGDDGFVPMGGNSLSAMELQVRLHDKLNVVISSGELLCLSTPEKIADYIKNHDCVLNSEFEKKYSFDQPCPLSESQLNVYLDERVRKTGTAYNNPFIIRFPEKEKISKERMLNALWKLFERFPVLKGRIISGEENLSLVFDAEPVISLGTLKEVDSFVRPFETDRSLSRFLISEDAGSLILCADFHHLIFDGSSVNVILDAFFAALEGIESDDVDYGVLRETAFEETVSADTMEEAADFYKKMFADREDVCDLIPSIGGTREEYDYLNTFDPDMDRLNDFLKKHSLTFHQFLAGVFAYTLSRFSGSEKVLFNIAEDGRGHIDLSGSVGMFVKTLPVLLDCGNQEVASFLKQSAKQINSAMKYDLYPFRLLAKEYELNSKIMFQYSHTIFEDATRREGFCYEIEEMKHDLNVDMAFNIFRNREGKLTIRILYGSDYSKDFIERFAQSYKMILRGMVNAEKLGEIRYITDSDLEILDRYNWTDTSVEYEDILDAFNVNLLKFPKCKLVEYGDVSYTFEQGAYFSDRIRTELLALGVKPDDRVGFLIPRSALYLFCILGIMSAGAAYVPLDEKLPDARIEFMMKDAGAKILLVSDETCQRAEEIDGKNVILFNISGIMKEETGRLHHLEIKGGTLACLLYTSGSTGNPKGVKITRDSLRYFIDFHVHDLDIMPGDVYGLYASIGFDVSMAAIFSVIYSGACMNVIPDEIKLNIRELKNHFMKYHITHSYITTQIAKMLIEEVEESSLKVLVAGGEKLGEVSTVRHYRIIDAYGPTEACVYVISADTRKKIDACSVGYVQNNVKAYILDHEFRRVPVGAVGGLYLSGPQLAAGYLNLEEETAKAFLPNPFEESGKYAGLYYTGDVARVLPDGTYGIVGRRDGQVKVRGNRIELSAVESMIGEIDVVKEVSAWVINRNGNNVLLAYVVSDELDEKALSVTILEYLSGKAPAFMVPSFVIKLDRIPLNVNGKVDRRALPLPDETCLHADYEAPENEMEQTIVTAFERVFHREKIGVRDDFISLGGDSLTAILVLSHMGECGVTVADILRLRTPKAIAKGANSFSFNPDVYTLESGCPLNNTQKYILGDIINHNKYDSYLIPSIIPIPGKYSDEQIINAMDLIFGAYPVLTMHIGKRENQDYLVRGEKPVIMKASLNPADVLSRLTKDFNIYESLSRHMIVRFLGKCYLVSLFHHLIFDVTSGNVFRHVLKDILDGGKTDYVDDAFLKLSAFHQQIQNSPEFDITTEYARSVFENLEHVGFLTNTGEHGKPGYLLRNLDVDPQRLQDFIINTGINKNILFTAVLACTLSALTGKDDVGFGYIENGRDRFGNYNSIGLFINALPMVVHANHQNVGEFLKNLSELYYRLMQYNYYPFGPMVQEYGISPLILFQFLPDWLVADGGYDKLPFNENVINLILSSQSDFLAEALIEVVQREKDYCFRVYYSGYYSRTIIKSVADTYRKILSRLIKCEKTSEVEELLQ